MLPCGLCHVSDTYLCIGHRRAPQGTGIAPVWSLKHSISAFHHYMHCMQSDLAGCLHILLRQTHELHATCDKVRLT